MARTLHSSAPTNINGSGTDVFWTIAGNGIGEFTSELRKQTPIFSGGVFNNLKIYVPTNDSDGTTTVKLRINEANGNCSISIATTLTGLFEDTVNSDTVATTDKLNFGSTSTGTSGTLSNCQTSISFAATTNTAQLLINGSNTVGFTDDVATVIYWTIAGSGTDNQTTEANTQFTFRTGGTLRNASWFVVSNGRASDTTARSRIGGVNGNIAVVATASTTGLFQDTTNTDAIVAGNVVNWSVTSGSAEAANLLGRMSAMEFITTDETWESISSSGSITGQTVDPANTRYFVIGGGTNSSESTESIRQTKIPFSINASNLFVRIITNAATTDGSSTLFVNGSATGLTTVVTALTTGIFVDNTNTASVSAGSTISIRFISGDTDITGIGILAFKATNSTISASGSGGLTNLLMMGVG